MSIILLRRRLVPALVDDGAACHDVCGGGRGEVCHAYRRFSTSAVAIDDATLLWPIGHMFSSLTNITIIMKPPRLSPVKISSFYQKTFSSCPCPCHAREFFCSFLIFYDLLRPWRRHQPQHQP